MKTVYESFLELNDKINNIEKDVKKAELLSLLSILQDNKLNYLLKNTNDKNYIKNKIEKYKEKLRSLK